MYCSTNLFHFLSLVGLLRRLTLLVRTDHDLLPVADLLLLHLLRHLLRDVGLGTVDVLGDACKERASSTFSCSEIFFYKNKIASHNSFYLVHRPRGTAAFLFSFYVCFCWSNIFSHLKPVCKHSFMFVPEATLACLPTTRLGRSVMENHYTCKIPNGSL